MQSDVLVIGAGGAGLTAALSAHQNGASVTIITKEYPTRSQTSMAQGGINAPFGNIEDDSIKSHIENTLKSSHNIADESAVDFLCSHAKEAVEWLDSIGVAFSRTPDAKIAQRKLGGASVARACYAQDYTGLKILHTLYDQCLFAGIKIINERYLVNISQTSQGVDGVDVLNIKTGDIEHYSAKSIILATGGYSRIYNHFSTNSKASSGDGIAVALKAGVKVSDMEFVQFHPTALKDSAILISESARGAGGYLLNSKGERFVDELLPRDEVSRAIYNEIAKGEDVFLDIRHLGEKFIDEELPQERKLAKLYENIDPLYDLIPIKPAAHYTMGGIEVDLSCATNIVGLYSVGECANHHVHGANRLGGNSLLELIVFGKVAGQSSASFAKTQNDNLPSNSVFILEYNQENIAIDFYEIKEKLGALFYNNVGIVREEQELIFALQEVNKFIKLLPKMGVEDKNKIYNTNLRDFLEFSNVLYLSRFVLEGAIQRKESRGAHFRKDFLDEDTQLATQIILDKDGVKI